jgi:hypothetical protein
VSPRFQRSAAVAARRARVLALRTEQVPYAEIARQLGVTLSVVKIDYMRGLQQYARDQAEQAHLARDRELAKLDQLEHACWKVLRTRHITVQHGKIVRDEDGQVVEDDAPVLNAVDRLVRIAHRRATLLGMDAPARVEVSDATDQAIRQLAAELAAAGGMGDMEPGRAPGAAGDTEAGQERPAAT